MKKVTFRGVAAKAAMLIVICFAWLPPPCEAACMVTCRCYDRHYGGSETQGPFQSTAACQAAVNNMSARCKSGGPYLMVSCTSCSNCEPVASSPTYPTPPPLDPAAQAAAEAQKRAAAQAAAEAQARANEKARQEAFLRNKQKLLSKLRVNSRPPAQTVLQQLGCVQGQSGDPRGGDWSNAYRCPPVMLPTVPEPPMPTAVDEFSVIPSEPAALMQYLSRIATRIGKTRDNQANTYREIAVRKQEIAVISKKTQDQATDKPGAEKEPTTGESDAMKKALEALAQAEAGLENNAAELQRLEQLEQRAKAMMPPAAP